MKFGNISLSFDNIQIKNIDGYINFIDNYNDKTIQNLIPTSSYTKQQIDNIIDGYSVWYSIVDKVLYPMPTTITNTNGSYTVGLKFKCINNCTIKGIRLYGKLNSGDS